MGGTISLLVPFVIIIMLNSLITVLSKKPFGRCMPISMVLCMTVLFTSQMMVHTYRVGFAIILIAAVLSVPIIAFKGVKQCHPLLFPGLFLFLGIGAFVFFWDYHRSFVIFDEFYFWGPMISESLRIDQFYSVPESYLWIHRAYPPFITMFEFFWCKASGGYSESAASMAVHMLLFSFSVLPILETLTKKGKAITSVLWGLSATGLFLLFVFLLDPWTPRGTTTILVDSLVSILFAYGMWLVYKKCVFEGWFGIIEITLINTAIMMIKQVGIGFVLVISVYYLMSLLIDRKELAFPRKEDMGMWSITIAIPMVFSGIWTVYVRHLGIHGQFDASMISLRTLMRILLGREGGFRQETFYHYCMALLEKDIGTLWIPLSYAVLFVLVILIIGFYHWRFRQAFKQKDAAILAIAFVCCTFGYALVMAVLYVFCFNEIEMQNLSSYERYVASYVLGEFVLLLYIYLDLTRQREQSIKWGFVWKRVVVFAVIMIMLAPGNIQYLRPQGLNGDLHIQEQKDAKTVAKATKTGSTVHVIYDCTKTDPDWYRAYLCYLLYYAGQRQFLRGEDIFHADLNNDQVRKMIIGELQQCDYVYIRDTNDDVDEFLKRYVEGDVRDDTVYSVYNDGGEIILKPVSDD